MGSPETPPWVAVTGATGFLGSRLVRQLRGKGLRVRALVRLGRIHPDVDEVIGGDLADEAALASLVAGVRVVVHAAAAMGAAGNPQVQETNVLGTSRLLAAAEHAGVPRFVHVSSVAALSPERGPYAASKAEGEERVRRSSIAWMILRPPLLLGPGSQIERVLDRLTRVPWVPVPRSSANIRPIAATDAAAALVAACLLPGAERRTWDLPGRQGADFAAIVRLHAELAGRRVHVVATPVAPWRIAAGLAARLLSAPPLTPETLRGLLDGTPGDAESARRDLGFDPRSIEAAIRTG